jgi:hypothetical protein
MFFLMVFPLDIFPGLSSIKLEAARFFSRSVPDYCHVVNSWCCYCCEESSEVFEFGAPSAFGYSCYGECVVGSLAHYLLNAGAEFEFLVEGYA